MSRKIKDTDVYKRVLENFPADIHDLIFESMKDMIRQVLVPHEYQLVEGSEKIWYQEQDGLSSTVQFGYYTIFAYIDAHERRKISGSSRDANLCLLLRCGAFSYAELPKRYLRVMGVSGTLKTLSKPERDLLSDTYKIKKMSFIPSVYGQNQLEFKSATNKGMIIEQPATHHFAIVNEIRNRLDLDAARKGKRAVLVFFKSAKDLDEFMNSSEMIKSGFKAVARRITEDTPLDRKNSLIQQATTIEKITLLSREFGRGIDFVCSDATLIKNGGVHVIQTFFSEEISEGIPDVSVE